MSGYARIHGGAFDTTGVIKTVNTGLRGLCRIELVNTTDATKYEKTDQMAAANSIKVVTAGTMTYGDYGLTMDSDNGTFTMTAALAANAKSWVWQVSERGIGA